MSSATNRRAFLQTSLSAGAVACVGDFGFLSKLPALSAQEVRGTDRAMVQMAPDIEPLVRFIEDTDRDRLLEGVAERIRQGVSYQQWLTALMLAGVRGIQPRPVGFKFHAVLVVNSAHLASLAATDQDRWLPLFWSLDNYKGSQARNRQEGNWVMAPVNEGQLPDAVQAARRFRDAMDNWDTEGADRSVAALARTAGANDVYEMFWRYGARDFRDIGHKAIFVANSYRTLQSIGWRHAEPILRSLAYALLEHEAGNPAQRDDSRDRPWRDNLRRVTRIRADWQRGQVRREAAADLLATLRTANPEQASDCVVRMLNDNNDPSCIWDGLLMTSGELLMRQPGIVGLHTVTTMNALYFAYQNCANDETRRLMMLQAAAFLTLFRENMRGRGQVRELRLDTLEPAQVNGQPAQAIEDVFQEINRDRMSAARKALGLLQAHPNQAQAMLAAARRLIFSKGSDSHDYKFSSAILEDFFHSTSHWRDRFLASGMFYLRGAGGQDTGVYRRTRAALGG
ncbi:MAG: hypothetical protein L0215_07990 [Gemmataceae bacterium]|nr:hypothetical protein [Gemmataceae bacterium]